MKPSMTPSEVTPEKVRASLIALLALFSDASKWTQRAWARKASGEETDPMDPEATCFCLAGGVQKVTDNGSNPRFNPLRRAVNMALMAQTSQTHFLGSFNDRATFEEVHTVIVKALAEA